jgi:hypothetical protein
MTEQKIMLVPQGAARGATAGKVADGQKLTIRVMRYNPADPQSVPHLQTYELEQSAGMTLFIALNEIRETRRCSSTSSAAPASAAAARWS